MCWHNSYKTNYKDNTISCQRQIRRKVQKVTKLVINITRKLKLNLSIASTKKLKSLIEMEHPLNIS